MQRVANLKGTLTRTMKTKVALPSETKSNSPKKKVEQSDVLRVMNTFKSKQSKYTQDGRPIDWHERRKYVFEKMELEF